VEPLKERIVGRVTASDVVNPLDNKVILAAGEEITEAIAAMIEASPVEAVEIRSVLTCASVTGVCVKCYGRNLATNRTVQIGESVGVIAAQSIGEPGTQLTLRTFHVGGVAGNIATESQLVAKFDGLVEFDEVRTVTTSSSENENLGGAVEIVVSRSGEIKIMDPKTRLPLMTNVLPYGATLSTKAGAKIKKGDLICTWDPYNALIISEFKGKADFEHIAEGVTYREESDEQTGHKEKVIIDTKDKTRNPAVQIVDSKKNLLRTYNLPVGAHLQVNEGDVILPGSILAKIPRSTTKTRDITGGLPRVTELFEARNPSNPAVVSEIDGVVTFGGVKRGNREIQIESRDGQIKKYLVPLSKHILVQDKDFVKAGDPLSDGAITPAAILSIKGPGAVQEYLVNNIQEVYRLQGVKINDKHFEVIVRQMMQKVVIIDPGNTTFLEQEVVNKQDFMRENDDIFDKQIILDPGDSNVFRPGQIVPMRKVRDENSALKRRDMKLVVFERAVPATSQPLLQGITRASLGTKSFVSAASFQETTKVLNEAAIAGKVDELLGLKENVIVGHLIPAGTGIRAYEKIVVGSMEEYQRLMASKEEFETEESVLQD
ncbi:MAG: DNA-directed RNA polymerase subunit beta', partial [Sphingobacteriia bacterium]|nr:DNA-directed RNA polymerase subunit beta' [Sphingobacteriia bacterium]